MSFNFIPLEVYLHTHAFLNYLIYNAISKKTFFYNHSFVNKPLSMAKRQRGCYIIKNSVQVRPCAYELWLVFVTRRGNKPLSPVKTLSVCVRVRMRVCVCACTSNAVPCRNRDGCFTSTLTCQNNEKKSTFFIC